jgi:hypothetical protein
VRAGANVLRLKAVTQVEADALIRVLQLFRGRNVVPRRVSAERMTVRGTTSDVLQIEIELSMVDISLDNLRLITEKIKQMPIALSAVFIAAASSEASPDT